MAQNRQIIALNKRIVEIKRLLRQNDYKRNKYIDGELSEAEYAPIREQYRLWRAEINALEEEIAVLKLSEV